VSGVGSAFTLFWGGLAALLIATPCWSDSGDHAAADVPGPDASGVQASAAGPDRWSWLNPATAPFIPVPEIATDPNGGTTFGILPTWLHTDEHHEIRRIIAPDVLRHAYFGLGFHARMYAYPSEDLQWSLLGGAKQRVEREFDAEYQIGRLRNERWSFAGSLIYDRDGTPRFYGIGNETPQSAQTTFTNEQSLVQGQAGLNLSRIWQLLYTGRVRLVDLLPGTIPGVPSFETRFGGTEHLGTTREVLNRLSIVYDTRDDLTVPSRGMKWVAYAGVASRRGILNASLYSEAGLDGRAFLPIARKTILATHLALRYLPVANDLPFWALSSLGGGRSVLGGEQPLRGFGVGRFYDRNSFSSSVEVRRTALAFNAFSTHVELEVAPFVDVGRVFANSGTSPITKLHKVGGVAFRAIARPSVVGYVDIGYGSEGAAVFSGINYPF
jgi:outer membrane protein assembly factor BamA